MEGAWRLDVGVEIYDKDEDDGSTRVQDCFEFSGNEKGEICIGSSEDCEASSDDTED